jgi:hypothetical protein
MDKQLRYVVTGQDKGASKTLQGVAAEGEKTTSKIGSAFSRLSGVVGGEVGELASKLGDAFNEIGEAGGKSLSEKLAVGGTALAGIGSAFTLLGAGEKQATDQLNLAIQNTGKNAADFGEDIEKSVTHMEGFGYTAVQTKDALTTLTNGTHDPKKALDLLGEAADYAAVKHVSLTDAATAIIRVLGGSTRSAREMGVQIVKNADGTTNYAATNAALAKVINGQATAASDNFGGTLKRLRAEVEDGAAAFGQKYGPAITSTGVAFIALAPIVSAAKSGAAKIGAAFRTSAVEAEGSAAAIAGADEEIAAANEGAAASSGKLGSGMLSMGGKVATTAVIVGAAMIAGDKLGRTINNAIEKNNAFAFTLDHLSDDLADFRTKALNSSESTDKLGAAWVAAELHADGLDKKAAAAGITTDELTKAVTGDKEAFADLIKKWQAGGKPSGDTITALGLLAEGYQKTKDGVDKAKASTDSETRSLAQAAQQGIATKDAINQLQNGFTALNGATMDAERANLTFKNDLDQVTASVKQNGTSLSDNSAAGRANKGVVLDAIQAAQQHAQAVLQQTGSTVKATAAFNGDTGALKSHLIQLGFNKTQVADLIAEYAKMPALKVTTVDVRAEKAALDTTLSQLTKATGHPWSVEVDVDENITSRGSGSGDFQIKMEAAGTDYFPGGSTLVAEREAELINLPRGASVTPLSKLRGATSGSNGGILVQINTPQVWAGNSMDLARTVVSALEAWRRHGGQVKGITN